MDQKPLGLVLFRDRRNGGSSLCVSMGQDVIMLVERGKAAGVCFFPGFPFAAKMEDGGILHHPVHVVGAVAAEQITGATWLMASIESV